MCVKSTLPSTNTNTKEELNLPKILNSHHNLVLQSGTVPSRSGCRVSTGFFWSDDEKKRKRVFMSDMGNSCKETHLGSFKLNTLWAAISWRSSHCCLRLMSRLGGSPALFTVHRQWQTWNRLNIPDALSRQLVCLWRAGEMSSGGGVTTLLRRAG